MNRLRLLLGLAASLSVRAADMPPKTRLAEVEDIAPKSYRADLTLDPEQTVFSGTITINMEIRRTLRTIWLNQTRITIQAATLTAAGKERRARLIPGGNDFAGLQFDRPLPPGPAVATIRYTGVVEAKNSSGIFRQREGGSWYIYSQFEATDARAAFPCFDEPSYKTPWQLTIHVPEKNTAVSNTPVASETRAGGMKTLVFAETRPLPSYLVAFGVGPFEFVDAGVAGRNKVPVRIVVPQGKRAEAQYAAEVTAPILTRLEDYFGIPYPYEKADQLSIPNTAGFGAMENAGLVTYDQALILADPRIDTINRQRTYATVAAHELAHQWFGDLVTTAWWDDIWLNEAFATWMERKLIAEWKPEWQTRVADVSAMLRAEQDDSLVSARKIRQEILSKDDINNAFDNITYEKGASVIGMFENWMGPEQFRRGVQSYLRQYAFRSTTVREFLDALSASAKRDVSRAFSTFLNQTGVPLVSVALQCNGGKAALQLEQSRFLPLGSKGLNAASAAPQVWEIPLCVRYGAGANGQSQCMLLTQRAATVELTGARGCPAWVQANEKAAGYYRVQYKGGLLTALTAGDARPRLQATERVDLMGDAQALSKSGHLSPPEVFALVETFHDDPDRYVMQAAINLAFGPRQYLVPDSLLPNYRRFLLKNFQARARDLGWTAKPGESEDTQLLRASLLRPVATWAGDTELAAQAKALTAQWFTNSHAVDPNLLGSVLATAGFYGDKVLFDRFLAEFATTKDKGVRRALLSAMNSFRDAASIETGMKALLNGTVPFIEGESLLFNGQQETATSRLPLAFLRANWDEIVAKMPTGGGFDFGSLLPNVGAGYCDASSRDELKNFLAPRIDRFVGAPRALSQTLEQIDLCIASKAAQAPGVAQFLSKY